MTVQPSEIPRRKAEQIQEEIAWLAHDLAQAVDFAVELQRRDVPLDFSLPGKNPITNEIILAGQPDTAAHFKLGALTFWSSSI